MVRRGVDTPVVMRMPEDVILDGFRMRSAGQVSVLGEDPAHAGEAWRARIGVVLQSWRDHAKWQVRELLAHLGSYYAPYSDPGGAWGSCLPRGVRGDGSPRRREPAGPWAGGRGTST